MFEFCVGTLLGIFIGQTFMVPNIQNCIYTILQNLNKYKKNKDDTKKDSL